MDQTSAPAAGADAARDEGISSVAAAVAEMDRREQARAAARKAEKAKASAESADPDDDDDGEADGRRPPKRPGEKEEGDEAKPKKAKARDDDDDAEDRDDDTEDDDADDADDRSDEDERDEDEADERDDDAPKKDKDEPPPKLKLRFQGREVEASPEHVQEYIDHTERAAQEVRTQQEQIHQVRQQLAQQVQFAQQQASALAALAQHVMGAEPSLELAQADPQAYLVQQGLYRQRQQVLQQLLQHAQSAAGQAHDQAQQTTQQRKAAGQQALLKAMPELADPQKLAAFSGRALKVAQEYGFGTQDLDTMLHPGFYVMLRDLGRLRDMDAGREGIKKKLAGAPPLKTPEQRASASPRDAQGLRAKDAKRAFMKSDRSMRAVREYLDRTSR